METPASDTSLISYALRACVSCKRKKTKCDKLLPGCTICTSKAWNCDYSEIPKTRKTRVSATKPGLLTDIAPTTLGYGGREPERTNFPAVFFLDPIVFKTFNLEIPRAQLSVPPYVKELLGDNFSIRETVAQYFKTVHGWMAILSKKRFYVQQLNPLSQPRADAILLLLCIKLMVWLPPEGGEDAKTLLYTAAKSFYSELEIVGTCSIQLLQAGIFIALYEVGHGIYPAAFMSIGACARYGTAFGFDDKGTNKMGKTDDWMAIEERKRAWWAIVTLDRFVTLGDPTRTLATQEPDISSILPIDDKAWDDGLLPVGISYNLASPSSISMGRFARFVQAAYLLGRVLRHAADETLDKEFHEQEATQLYRTISALVSLSEVDGNIKDYELCSQVAICYSALLILHQSHNDMMGDISSQMEQIANIGQAIPRRAVQICRMLHTSPNPDHSMDTVSPLLLPYFYRATLLYDQIYQKSNDEESYQGLVFLKEGLVKLSERWQAAGTYLEILKARDVMYF